MSNNTSGENAGPDAFLERIVVLPGAGINAIAQESLLDDMRGHTSRLCRERTAEYFLIAASCLAVYWKCLFFGITNSDDEVLITGNLPFLRDAAHLFQVFTSDAFYKVKSIDLYRPLQSVSFILDAQWGGDVVFNAHLTNLLLHIALCIALFHLLLNLKFRRETALAGALVYSVHYLFLSAVAWLPARGDLLLALFTVLAVITFIRTLEYRCLVSLVLHPLFFAAATFSKESAVVLPVLLLAYIWSYAKQGQLKKWHLVLPPYYLAVQTIYFILKGESVAKRAGEVGVIPFLRNIRTLPEMTAKFFLPVNISTLPQFKTLATLSGILIISLLVIVHIRLRKRLDRRIYFYLAWFLLFILPGMAYFPNFYNFFYEHVDHRAYLVSIGLLMLLLNLVEVYGFQERKWFWPVILLLLVYLAALNFHFSSNYKNSEEFARSAIRTNPNSALAFMNFGVEKYNQGKDDEALINLSEAIRICSIYMPALHYRALIYLKREQYGEALADLNTLLTVDPAYSAEDYYLRGVARVQLKEYAAAKVDFESSLLLDPGYTRARNTLREMQERVRF